MFGNEKNTAASAFNGDGNNLSNGATSGFVGAEGVKTGIPVNGAGGGNTTAAAIAMKSECFFFIFIAGRGF